MDTITAISTPLGEGGIGIVRLSGEKALQIANQIFSGNVEPSYATTHTVHYGKIIDPKTQKKIDEVLLIVMKKPNTYTGEDMIEINAHGGITVLNKILELTLQAGARLAEPGEFTRRTFLSGRIDLAQAEAVLDVIRAKTDKSLAMAMTQLEGRLSKQANEIKDRLVEIESRIEASIDFPEDVGEWNVGEIVQELAVIYKKVTDLIKSGESGKLIREGATIPIVGRANVGKSSLFNAIISEDRAIVTPYPGTTRDTVESWISVEGIPVKLIDTAGISESRNPIEIEGIKRTQKAIEEADIILFVVDQSEGMTEEDIELLTQIKHKKREVKKIISILNKCDLAVARHKLSFGLPEPIIRVSALRGDNVDLIVPTIANLILVDNTIPIVAKTRHIHSLTRTNNAIERIQKGCSLVGTIRLTPELVSYELKEAINALGEITGEITTEDILDHIFSEFCIGK